MNAAIRATREIPGSQRWFLPDWARQTLDKLPFVCLILSLVIGGAYRVQTAEEKFEIWNGFSVFVDLAAHYRTTLGRYDQSEVNAINANPDDYVFRRDTRELPPSWSINNEVGWPFILSLIIPEGTQGIKNIAMIVLRYQIMLDMLVIVMFYFLGRAIAGIVGAIAAPLAYAIFQMPMVMASWVVYYYWPIPLSVAALLAFVKFYELFPLERNSVGKLSYALGLGLFIGFATHIRLHFLLLPLVYIPFMAFKGKCGKKSLVVISIFLLGHLMAVSLLVAQNKSNFGRAVITTRGAWHGILQGVGAYPNPWGITDSGEVTLNTWIVAQGGPDLNTAGLSAWDDWSKKKSLELIRERPDIFLRNFLSNFSAGLSVSPHFLVFHGLLSTDQDKDRLKAVFPWLVLASIILLYYLDRPKLFIYLTALSQGLLFLLLVTMYFVNYIPWMGGYIPIFALLTATSVSIVLQGASRALGFFVRSRFRGA
ncbi:MAG: hypothetical protein HQK81_11700 [Desulfovibrionaceae bacterium]|nr:hypothetical protein [Desulfovibrionaceae bacterium]MBF0514705.1 hypothetical protein [Desulfovibrionaceae bacterium]